MYRATVLVALLAALLALAACQSQEPEISAEDQAPQEMVQEEGENGGSDGGSDGGGPDETVEITAVDINFEDVPDSVSAGLIEFVLDNTGSIEHNLHIEELGEQVVPNIAGGETGSGTAELESGSYTLFCSVAGHRSAGMEATIEAQ